VKSTNKSQAWLRRQIAAAASLEAASEKPFLPVTNEEFITCSHAILILASTREGRHLSLPSACLPPLH